MTKIPARRKNIDGYRFKSDLIEGFINVINSMQNHDCHKILKQTLYINCWQADFVKIFN